MLIVFNKSGSEFSVDFQYDSFSQGDSNTHIVDVIVEDTAFSNYEYNGYVQFLREGEKEPSPKLIMATKRMEYNGNYYSGYTFKMESDWFTAIAGTLKMTIEIKKYNNGSLQSNKAYGVVNIPVQESVSAQADVDSAIADEEYNAMIELINSKLNVADEKVYVLDNNYATIYEFATACIEIAQNNTMDRIFFGNIVSRTQTGLTTTEKCVATITEKFRSQVGTSYNALVITSTGDVVVTDGTTKLESLAKDSRVLHTIGFLKEVVTGEKTFETNDGTAPVHLKSSFPYVVSDTASKVGMRAYTEDGEYQGEIAGQFAVSKDDANENGHFANIQARDNSGDLHTLRVSGKGVSYFKNSERHNIPLDENVIHNLGGETLKGSLTIKAVAPSSKDVHITNEHIKLNDASNTLRYVEVTPSTLVLNDFKNSVTIHPQGIYTKNEYDEAVTYFYNFPKNSGTIATEYFAKNYTDNAIANLIDNAPQTLDTFKEIADYIAQDKTGASQMTASINKNKQDIATNTNQINALEQNKLDKEDLVYENVENAPEKINIVVRDTISADTYNEAREIQIGRDKFKFGSGSKIKVNEFVDGTLPTLEYLNIDGKTYQLPNYVVDKSVLKLVAEEIDFSHNSGVAELENYTFDENKLYLIEIIGGMEVVSICRGGKGCYMYYVDGNDNATQLIVKIYNRIIEIIDVETLSNYSQWEQGETMNIYEIPLGESAQVEKHNKTINALMQRVSDLEQKAGLTSVGYVQDSTLNLIRVNVVDDVLEVSGFKFDGEVMII